MGAPMASYLMPKGPKPKTVKHTFCLSQYQAELLKQIQDTNSFATKLNVLKLALSIGLETIIQQQEALREASNNDKNINA